MRRGPWIAAAAPFLIGFVILFGIAILASWLGEHRIWPRSPETQWIVVGGEFALIATYLAAAMAMVVEEVCGALSINDDAAAREAIAIRIVELARRGERNPDKLRDRLLRGANNVTGM